MITPIEYSFLIEFVNAQISAGAITKMTTRIVIDQGFTSLLFKKSQFMFAKKLSAQWKVP